MSMRRYAVALAAAIGLAPIPVFAETLTDVMDKGYLQCGVTTGVLGFSALDKDKNWAGLEVDYCRALSAAIFNDPDKVRYTSLTSLERFDALSSGNIDVLSRTTTWTMKHDTQFGINFVGVMYYDGQGFMVRKDSGIASTLNLADTAICVETGTTTELNVGDYFLANNLEYNPVKFVDQDAVVEAYESGRCNVYTADSSTLASERQRLAKPDEHVILPQIISKEPLGPSVRQGDDIWFNIARWTYFALLNAEELGVTQANVDEMLGSDNPAIKRLLGVEGDFGSSLGLSKDWAYQIITHVGNYGDMYERHVGPSTLLGLERGINALWTNGGIQYAPPIR